MNKNKCSWYSLKPRELSSKRPNFRKGDLLVFRRKLKAWVDLHPTHEVRYKGTPDERPMYRGNTKSFSKGTIAIVLGEEFYQNPKRLVPDLVLHVGEQKVWLENDKVHHLSRLTGEESDGSAR